MKKNWEEANYWLNFANVMSIVFLTLGILLIGYNVYADNPNSKNVFGVSVSITLISVFLILISIRAILKSLKVIRGGSFRFE